jgi:leucyl aminopeptidase
MALTFADPASPSLAIHVVSSEAFAEWLARQPSAWQTWLGAQGFDAALGEMRLLPAADGTVEAAVVGFGTARTRARTRFGLARALQALPAGNWHLEGDLDLAQRNEAALGALLTTYRFDRYRPAKSASPKAKLKAPKGCDTARLIAMADGEFLTRDLINTPASDMGPAELEDAFVTLAAGFDAKTEVIRGDDLLSHNFPMIHAVGRASPRAPRILSLRWGTSGPRLTLVGKGVCFDTGGLDIKPSSGMLLMKKDMGGAANVMGLAHMIMTLNLPVQLRVIVPAVENAISGNAMRPSDILTSRKGLTVEINNTDAEGRLILADALAWADEERPDAIISMATLTGAARVAVGPDLAPFYTDDDAFAEALSNAASGAFDPVWRMPFWDPYEPMIEPKIADLDNAPAGSFAGSITAALFLRRFVSCPRFMHFDIYGHTPADAPARPKGGVGQGTRALLAALPKVLNL